MGLKFKVSHDLDSVSKKAAILYILELDVDDRRVVKIGVTSRGISDRVVEILSSHFKSYRFFCWCKPKRFRTVDDAYGKEAILLRYFSDRKYESAKKFSGCQELVDVDVLEVVEVYERLLGGEDVENTKSSGCEDQQEAASDTADE